MFGTFLPAIVSESIQEIAAGGLVDEEEDGYLDEIFDFIFFSTGRYGSAYIPLGSTVLMMPFNLFDDKPYNDRITLSPSVSILESSLRAPVSFYLALTNEDKDLSGRNVKDMLTFMSLVTGIPLTILGKPIGYQVDVNRGKVDPLSLPDYLRGLVTGKPSQPSRN